MLEQRLVREFAERLNEDIRAAYEELEPGTQLSWDVALLQVAMGFISETGAASTDDLCPHEDTEGRDRCKIVAYSIDEEEKRLLLFTTLYLPFQSQEELPQLPRDEVVKWASWAARFFRLAVKNNSTRFLRNPAAAAAMREVHRKLSQFDDVLVTFITNARVRDRALEPMEEIGKQISFEVWDLERLQRAGDDAVTRDRIEVDFTAIMGRPLAVLEKLPAASEYQTYLAILPGETLYRLYEEYGARLFEFNVRSFLQATGKVNKGIRNTLADAVERERFLAYNNGITATADEMDVGTEHGQTVIRTLRGLQIVNGAQTTASIHRARKQDKADLSMVAVAMKLTRVAPAKLAEFVPLISRYANTQNPVQVADLSANSPFHVRLEQISEKVWCPGEESRWFYERSRGAYQVARNRNGLTKSKRAEFDAECPREQRFGKTELAKAWMSWWQMPHIVSRGSQKNYTAFMGELERRKGPGWEPDEDFLEETAALLMLTKAAQKACRKAALGSYMANVVAALLARVSFTHGEDLQLLAIWDNGEVSSELSGVLLEWAPIIHAALRESAGNDNVTEHAKKEGSWGPILRLEMPWPVGGTPETKAIEPEVISPVDIAAVSSPALPKAPTPGRSGSTALSRPAVNGDAAVRECLELDGPAWGRIIGWAAGSPLVAPIDRKIATTVLQYALDGWSRSPSPKQAKFAVRVLAAARRAGVSWQDAAA